MEKENQNTSHHFSLCSLCLLILVISFCHADDYILPDIQQSGNIEQYNNAAPPITYVEFRSSSSHNIDNHQIIDTHFKSNKWKGRNLVHTCAETGCYGVLDALLNGDAKVNDRNKNRNTPLHLACTNHHPPIVKLLLLHKADVELRNRFDDAAMHLAAQSECLDCIVLLANYGADINVKGKDGFTALHYAVMNEDISMIIFLLKRKANKTIVDNKGKKPLQYAKTSVIQDILEGIVDLDDVSSL